MTNLGENLTRFEFPIGDDKLSQTASGMLLIAVGRLKTPCSSQDLDSKKMSKVSGRRGRSVLNGYIIFKPNKVSLEDK